MVNSSRLQNRDATDVISQNFSMRTMINILSSQYIGLHICHINAQSILPKFDEFKYLFEGSKVDVVCVSETWLSSDISDDVCSLNGFHKPFRSDRVGRIGGGSAIFVRKEYDCKFIRKASLGSDIDYVFLEIMCNENKILLGSVYRPNNNIDSSMITRVIDELSFISPFVIVVGDFNSNILNDSCLVQNMSTLNLFPVNTSSPTHFTSSSSTLLDVFFVSYL